MAGNSPILSTSSLALVKGDMSTVQPGVMTSIKKQNIGYGDLVIGKKPKQKEMWDSWETKRKHKEL